MYIVFFQAVPEGAPVQPQNFGRTRDITAGVIEHGFKQWYFNLGQDKFVNIGWFMSIHVPEIFFHDFLDVITHATGGICLGFLGPAFFLACS